MDLELLTEKFIIFIHLLIGLGCIFILVFCTNINIVLFGFISSILIYIQTIYCDGCNLSKYEGDVNIISVIKSFINDVLLDEDESLNIKSNHMEKLIVFCTVILFTGKLTFLLAVNYIFGMTFIDLLCSVRNNQYFSYIL